MRKFFVIWIIVVIALLGLGTLLMSSAFNLLRKGAIESYKPDTTITIHNGKPDTVIVKKSVPGWLK